MTATIGIKIANGEYYSILEENSSVKKRLILTTVHDNQHSVQIDLYRSFALSMADAQYIGSLVLEKILPRPKGEPSIELVISSNEKGDITAEALDLDTGHTGEHQILSVSLKSLDEHIKEYEIPDFELEQNDEPPTGLYARAQSIHDKESRKFPWMVLIIIGIIIVLALAATWFFVFGGKDAISDKKGKPAVEQPAPAVQPPAAQKEDPPVAQKSEPPAAQKTEPPVIQAPVVPPPPARPPRARNRPPAPVSSYKVPATIPPGGVPYTIRWGDTLWDISEAFYRNPWLYPRIARFNNIRNPDHIIAGRTIRVPPKN
jgi:LysM repeat protein